MDIGTILIAGGATLALALGYEIRRYAKANAAPDDCTIPCPDCEGTGYRSHVGGDVVCQKCHGSGYVEMPLEGLEDLVDCHVCGGSGFSSPGTGYGDVCGHCGGQRQLPREDAPATPRIGMRNRFMPRVEGTEERADALADQIVADQHLALEKPGKRTHAPAPGEPGYVAPVEVVTVTAGPFKVSVQRDGKDCQVFETTKYGSEYRYAVPPEWGEVVAALVVDLYLAREDNML